MANTITHQIIESEAKRRGWSCTYYGVDDRFLQVENESGIKCVFRGTRPDLTSANGADIVDNKFETVAFVRNLGFKTPDTIMSDDIDSIVDFLMKQKEIVIKPLDSAKSYGVTVGITRQEEVPEALAYAHKYSKSNKVVAQEQVTGKLYRVFVIDDKVVAVSERRAATIIGDGKSTVNELIGVLNRDPRRGVGSEFALQTVSIESVSKYIGKDKLGTILEEGTELRIAAIESVSSGGMSIDVTDTAHASWTEAMTKITRELGLFVAGFDIITPDISIPMEGGYFPLLEINNRPGLKLHEFPAHGEPRHLAPLLLDMVFDKMKELKVD